MELFDSLEMPYTMQYGEVNSNIFLVNNTEKLNVPYSPAILLKKEMTLGQNLVLIFS